LIRILFIPHPITPTLPGITKTTQPVHKLLQPFRLPIISVIEGVPSEIRLKPFIIITIVFTVLFISPGFIF
jgi:hypothetical protein